MNEAGNKTNTASAGTPLLGKHLCFLGSSVTYGSASGGVSFAEMIAERNGATFRKEAVSGTTLVDNGDSSYISRMKRLCKEESFDFFICQLSTNDASRCLPLGALTDRGTDTVCGAIGYIMAYAHEIWGCPVVFYTNSFYENDVYAEMVKRLRAFSARCPYLHIIDLYSDRDFNAITAEERAVYMADKIHPTREGYLKWWTPYMEQALYGIINGEKESTKFISPIEKRPI